jgi:peptidyl-prolyl cis-trans isomerase C
MLRRNRLAAAAAGSIALGWLALAHGAPEYAAAAAHPPDADAARRSQIVASFDGGQITVGELEDIIAKKLPRVRAQIAADGRLALLDEVIQYDLLAQEAQRRGYHERPLVIEAAKRTAIEQLAATEFNVAPDSISAEDVARVHEAHRAEQSRPAWRRASEIVVDSEADARALIAELKGADRIRFAEIARQRSRDPRTARQGGELGFFDSEGKQPQGESAGVPEAVAGAVFALSPVGTIASEPVAHDGVFSVIMLTGEMPAFSKSLAKEQRSIRDQLAQERTSRAIEARLTALRDEYKPELHPELLNAIVLEPAVPRGIPEGIPAAPPDPRAPPRLVKPDGY